MTHAELETAYLTLCDTVVRDTQRIVGMCGNGRADAAGRATVNLMDAAADAKQQYLMQQEQTAGADRYDLAALSVNADAPSNSETGYEDRG